MKPHTFIIRVWLNGDELHGQLIEPLTERKHIFVDERTLLGSLKDLVSASKLLSGDSDES